VGNRNRSRHCLFVVRKIIQSLHSNAESMMRILMIAVATLVGSVPVACFAQARANSDPIKQGREEWQSRVNENRERLEQRRKELKREREERLGPKREQLRIDREQRIEPKQEELRIDREKRLGPKQEEIKQDRETRIESKREQLKREIEKQDDLRQRVR
jgi:hypothetical protein